MHRFDGLLYLLTYSMVHSPSWEANWFAASQVIPRISQNPKVHYRTKKRPPPLSILGEPHPVHIPTSHFLETNPNIIHQSKPRSPQWSPSLRFPHQGPIHPLSSPIRVTCPAHHILLDFITRALLGEEDNSFSSSLCSLLHSPVTSSLLGPNILLNITFSNTLRFLSSRNVNDHVSHPVYYTHFFNSPSYQVWSGDLGGHNYFEIIMSPKNSSIISVVTVTWKVK